MAFIETDDDNFQEKFETELSKSNTVILKFGSEWCDSCHALECELEELDESVENISILIIDCDESTRLAEKYKIQQMPTMIIYKDKDTITYHGEGVILCQDIGKIIDES